MTEYLGNVTVPTFADSGETFPIVPDWGYGYAQAPHVVVHQFGSGNAKIEQRFYQGTSAKRFTVHRARLSYNERVALRDFYESHTPYKSFSYRCPSDDGKSTTTYKVRFAEEPLSFSDLSDYISSTGVTLIEVPTTSPVYTLSATVTRFPSSALATALLDQAQEIIPLVKIQPREEGYPAIYVSDRRCTVGPQLYIPRLLDVEGISQGISGESDQASFTFGNADRAMRDLANDTNLLRASVEFSLFHVGSKIKLDLWKGEVVSWDMNAGPEFRLLCADGIYELTLPYPCRRISRTCWKSYNDAANCPYAAQSTGLDTTHFPSVDATRCDKSYDGPNGCLAHGMKRYFGGVLAEPQSMLAFASPFVAVTKSLIADSVYESILPEIYCNNPSYKDENNATKYGMPVECKIAAIREEGKYFSALGIVGEGPITYGTDHTLDGMFHQGKGTSKPNEGLHLCTGTDPAGATEYFSLWEIGDKRAKIWKPDWRLVYVSSINKTFKDNFAAGTAFVGLRRNDDAGIQVSKPGDHNLEAIVRYGIKGWAWTGPGARSEVVLSNPIWVAINMLLKAKGARNASATVAETYFDVDAAISAAAICDTNVSAIIGAGTEKQFTFQGTVSDERPLRDWITDVLMNCNGYYTWSFGKLKIGIRANSSAVEAFTTGNILFQSINLAPLRPSFNYLTGQFRDQEFRFADNNVTVYDEGHAKLVGGDAAALYLKAQIPLAGTSTKSQAARIVTTRLREELGGITADQWKDARELSFRTTVLSLAVEPGMVCSMTHPDMPGGSGEFRVTGWRLNKDFSIDISGRTTVDEMYDMTVGPKPADVAADPVPVEVEVVESPFLPMFEGLNPDGSLPDGSVTIPKLAVVPETINPDPCGFDEDFWRPMYGGTQAFVPLDSDGSNVAHQMNVPRCLYLTGADTTYTGIQTQVIPLTAAGKEIRFRYKAFNGANQTSWAGLTFINAAGADAGGMLFATQAVGSGHSSISLRGMVPLTAVACIVWMRNNGPGMTGEMAFSDFRVELPATTDLLVDDSVTGPKVLDGTLTADHITVTTLSSLVSNLGTVTAGLITGTTFRTSADAGGNYIELAGTKLLAKDSGGNVIWELLPNLGPMSVTDDDVSTYEVAINTSTCANEANMGGWAGSVNDPPNTPDGMAQAIAAAKAMYVSGTITGKWEVTELFATTPRSLLVSVNATTSSSTSARVRVGPITFKPTWQSSPVPGDPNAGYWTVDFMPAKSAIMTGFPANLTDTRIVIVPVLKLSNKLFIHRSYLYNVPATGKIRILGIFA